MWRKRCRWFAGILIQQLHQTLFSFLAWDVEASLCAAPLTALSCISTAFLSVCPHPELKRGSRRDSVLRWSLCLKSLFLFIFKNPPMKIKTTFFKTYVHVQYLMGSLKSDRSYCLNVSETMNWKYLWLIQNSFVSRLSDTFAKEWGWISLLDSAEFYTLNFWNWLLLTASRLDSIQNIWVGECGCYFCHNSGFWTYKI